jgi:tetratricopeptide (TPR) repeat protein
MKRIIFLFLLLPMCSIGQKQQQISKWQFKADQAFQSQKYLEAIELYKKAYIDLTDRPGKDRKRQMAEILFQIAECYRYLNEPKQEVQWYAKAIKAHCSDSTSAVNYLNAAQSQITDTATDRVRSQHYYSNDTGSHK